MPILIWWLPWYLCLATWGLLPPTPEHKEE